MILSASRTVISNRITHSGPGRWRRWIIRLRHWEYWPFAAVYLPILPVWCWYCLRARSFFFFRAANPSIDYGGFLMERKSRIYPLLPKGSYPATLWFAAGTNPQQVLQQVSQWTWPLIAKPDIGMQGKRVKKVNTTAELLAYASSSPVDFLVQAFVPYTQEAGIFYQRLPHAKRGQITGIVQKHFAAVTGDGQQTVQELLLREERYQLQWQQWQKDESIQMDYVPACGETYLIVPYGNHARGARFTDASANITVALTEVIDDYCRQIPGFYYGRLDIRYQSWESLCAGQHFSVIELNGAGSEPTHMYDPRHSLWQAWNEIIRHWRLLYETASAVHQHQKVPYLSRRQGWQMLRDNHRQVKLLD